MQKIKILIIRNDIPNIKAEYTNKHLQKIKKISHNVDLNLIYPKKEIVGKYLSEASILICPRYNFSDLLDFRVASKLRWVHITSAGTDDIALALKKTGVLLTNSSGVHPIPITEHVFAFLLIFSRQIYRSYRIQIEEKSWKRDHNILRPTELHDRTISIVGFGRIGNRIAKIAKSFGMNVVVLSHKTTVNKTYVDKAYPSSDIDLLLNSSDFVVNCLPLTKETKFFFTFKKFQQMKNTAYFINVGRGKTVVESGLIHALEEKIIAGAGLDVFNEEPLPNSSKLWNLKNVILTPHYAGWTPNYMDRVIDIFCINLQAYLQKKRMPNLVDKNTGY